VFDGLCGGLLQQTDTILALGLARDHTMPLYVAAGTYLNGLANWRAGDRMAGLTEMRRGWTMLRENDCYLCEPFWGMQVAMADAEVGQLETGLDILSELIASAGQSGQHWLDAELHRVQGELLSRHDPPDGSSAENAFNRALEIARHQQAKTFELRSALGLARLHKANGRAGAVFTLLAPVLAEFDAERNLPEVEEAEKLLRNGR
jgi:predicted ATPase